MASQGGGGEKGGGDGDKYGSEMRRTLIPAISSLPVLAYPADGSSNGAQWSNVPPILLSLPTSVW